MSVVGYRANNHPNQVATRGPLDEVDDRATEQTFVASLAARFGGDFTLDVAASEANAKCPTYFTRDDNGLRQQWPGRIWCNPPYSHPNLELWTRKAWAEWESGRPALIVMLLPANRLEQPWWQELVEPFRDRAGSPLRVEFLPGRLRFMRPGQRRVGTGERPPFGCCLLIWQRTGPAYVPPPDDLFTPDGEP